MNPTPGSEPKFLATGLEFGTREAESELAFEVLDFFRLSLTEVRDVASRMASVLSGWRRQARADGISEVSIDYMADCFEAGVRKLRALSR